MRLVYRQTVYLHTKLSICICICMCVCVCVCTQLYIEMSTQIIYMMRAHAQSEARKEKNNNNEKKTWKCKYKQRSKTNTKKESTINNKKNHKSTQHSVYWPETDRVRVPLHKWIAFFLYYAQLWQMLGQNRGGGGRRTTHLISLSNRVQHLQQQQQHLHNTQAPLQRF